MLVQAGKKEDLMVTDNTGLTPAQLASDKNHRQVAFFLVGVVVCHSPHISIFSLNQIFVFVVVNLFYDYHYNYYYQ